jgi:adenine-specific DNA-methyltransferase
MDAAALLRRMSESVDVAYLDPPYNQHQYGSNYHILNTIARWDRPPVSSELGPDGRLLEKAGIRHDWVRTRSLFCSRTTAPQALAEVIGSARARHILISYSTNGLVSLDDLYAMCSRRGRTTITSASHVRYPGGRRSNTHRAANTEFVLSVDTAQRGSRADRERLLRCMAAEKLHSALARTFQRERLTAAFTDLGEGRLEADLGSRRIVLQSHCYFTLQPLAGVEQLSRSETDTLVGMLEDCACSTKVEELEQLLRHVEEDSGEGRYFILRVPRCLKHIAHRKYRKSYEEWCDRIDALRGTHPELHELVAEDLERIQHIARKRFGAQKKSRDGYRL